MTERDKVKEESADEESSSQKEMWEDESTESIMGNLIPEEAEDVG